MMSIISDYIAKRKSWLKQNGLKAVFALLAGGIVAYVGMSYLETKGRIAILSGESCIANMHVAWVSYSKPSYESIKVNDLIAIDGSALPGHKQGQLIVKFVKAKEGDHVSVSTSRGGVFINDVFQSSSLYHATSAVEFSGKIPKNKLFMMGNTDISFDSRYFGPVAHEKVIGYATKLF